MVGNTFLQPQLHGGQDAGSAGRSQLILHVFASDGSDKGNLLSPITDIFQAKIYRDYGAKPVSNVPVLWTICIFLDEIHRFRFAQTLSI